MAVDVRATVTCSLGTLISANIADDYLQGTGLVLCRGSAEIAGLVTPAIGTVVTFAYKQNGGTRNLPRKLRVLSSFADPFRRTTRVELGCKLTYLRDLKAEVKWDAFNDPSNNSLTTADAELITIPIRASSIMAECLSQLGITASSNPLTNKFSIAEFDYASGYVNILSDLLVSECYCGYLDYNEVLQVFSLNQDGGTGPVVTTNEIIDLAPINVGQLPGEAVTVSYSSLQLAGDTPGNGDKPVSVFADYGWNSMTTSKQYVIPVSYRTSSGTTTFMEYNVIDTVTETASYVEKKIRTGERVNLLLTRVTVSTGQAVDVLGGLASECLSAGISFFNYPITSTSTESITYDAYGKEILKVVESWADYSYAFGEAGVPMLFPAQNGGFTIVEIPNATFLREKTVTETISVGNFRKIATARYGPWMRTIKGQQALATMRDSLTTPADVYNFVTRLADGEHLIDINITTEESSGSRQVAPSQADRINQANAKGGNPDNKWRTESKADLALALGSSTAQRRTEFSLPYAPDDTFIKTGASSYQTVKSDAEAKATAYGRVQNRLLLGNRSGMNLQLSPLHMPTAPFSPLVVQANGLSGLYRTNATSWTISAEGIVCSTDALFWGAVGGTGTFWFPVAPGVTSLPTTPAVTPQVVYGTDASGNTVPIGTVNTMSPGTVVTPYNETVLLAPTTRTRAVVTALPYSLQQTTALVATTRTAVVVQSLTLVSVPAAGLAITGNAPAIVATPPSTLVAAPVAVLTIAAAVPAVNTSAIIQAPATTLTLTAVVPSVATGAVVSVPASTLTLAGVAPVITTAAAGIPVSSITYSQSSQWPSTTLANNSIMTDGSFANTGAATDASTLAWISMDLGQNYAVAKVIIGTATSSIPGGWSKTYTENRDIQYSTDGTSWTTAANTGTFASNGVYTFNVSFTARYIRLSSSSPGGTYVALSEFYALAAGQTYPLGSDSGSTTDPNFSSVSLLLHFNGSNGSTTFTDSSSKAISVTTDRGSPAISTAESQFGGASLSLVNGASLTIPSNAAFTLDADFTVEMWVKRTGGTNQYDTILCANSSESDFLIRPDGLNPLVLVGGSSFANGWTTTLNTWHHIAVARSGSTVRAYKDGASIGSATNTSTIATSGFKLGISIAGTNRFFLGYIDELRITKGAARYTGTSFTPPAAPFPDS